LQARRQSLVAYARVFESRHPVCAVAASTDAWIFYDSFMDAV
jgi:hypothetical protein